MSPGLQVEDALVAVASRTARGGAGLLSSIQHRDGFWWGDLTADATLESDWLLLLLWLHPPQDGVWTPPDRAKVDRAVASILARQNSDGGFAVYPKGPSDVSASAKAYFALKLAGLPQDDPRLLRLRDRILALGGLPAANSYVKINLALFGLYPREHVPTVPPEIVLFGNWIYEMSSWTRAIVIPLSIIQSAAKNAPRPVPQGFHLRELIPPGADLSFHRAGSFFSWRNFFLKTDKLFKWWENHGSQGTRRKAIQQARQWMLDHLQNSGGLAAIYPSMQYSIMALDVLGFGPESPERLEAQAQFDALLVDDGERFFFQPCFSPVWDTAIAAHALGEAGFTPRDRMLKAGDWLLSKEARRKGDWSIKRPNTEPSGWYFEFANEFYPDIDDTAMVLLSLAHTRSTRPEELQAVSARAISWLKAMQSKDGGWAAFDVDNDRHILSEVPFADHNAMLDPTCPDVTGRVLEALCRWDESTDSPAVRRGIEYLQRTQESDGSWAGRWGVNYIYGTFLALRGLKAAAFDDREAEVLRAGEWLRSTQNADGGWGESCESYAAHTFVPAESTASQTAWAVLGLLAGGDSTSESVHRGVEFLVRTQLPTGGWHEELATGTGFPRVFYLTYHLYRHSFPVLALAEFVKTKSLRGEDRTY